MFGIRRRSKHGGRKLSRNQFGLKVKTKQSTLQRESSSTLKRQSSGLKRRQSLSRRMSKAFGIEDLVFNEKEFSQVEYMQQIKDLVNHFGSRRTYHVPEEPYEILDHLYLGNAKQAENVALLHQEGITHVINCCPGIRRIRADRIYMQRAEMEYLEFPCVDDEEYDIQQHFDDAFVFIEEARKAGGKVLIYSENGVNTSGYITIAYTMVSNDLDLLSAIKMVAEKRGSVLKNENFQEQLLQFASEHDMLKASFDYSNFLY